jgi:predicted kinase
VTAHRACGILETVKLAITRGLPGSGKTTWARAWVAEDPQRRARVNRDDLRAMLHDSVFLPQNDTQPGTERGVQAVRDATVSALLKRGVDVVCDDTNLPSRVVRDLRRLALLAGAEFEVIDLTDVPLDECLRRNALREGRARVPDARVREMHDRFIAGRPHPLSIPDEPTEHTGRPYTPRAGTPKTVMVDIDGTVALMGNRSPYDEARVHEDVPHTPVITAVRAMWTAGHTVVFCSGRTEDARAATEAWLREHVNVPYAALHMRKAGDQRKDSIVKLEIFDRYIRDNYDIVAVFDDRAHVVAAWRSIGLTVFAVAEGDF